MYSVGAKTSTFGGVSSAITTGRPELVPAAFSYFRCLEHRSVRIVGTEFRVEEGESVFERCKAPSEAMFGRPTIKTATAILYASLAARVLGEEGRPRR